jgi:hypothetical protein
LVSLRKVAISAENSLLLASLLKFGFESLKGIPSKVSTQQELLVVMKADTHERFKWILFTALSVIVELSHLFEKSRAAAYVELPNKLKSGLTAFVMVLVFQVFTTWFKHFTISCNNKLVGLQVPSTLLILTSSYSPHNTHLALSLLLARIYSQYMRSTHSSTPTHSQYEINTLIHLHPLSVRDQHTHPPPPTLSTRSMCSSLGTQSPPLPPSSLVDPASSLLLLGRLASLPFQSEWWGAEC